MTRPKHAFYIPATPCARVFQQHRPSLIQRAQGMPGARCTRSFVCRKTHEVATTGVPSDAAFPARMVLTVSFALSLVTGLFCHHPRCDAEHRHQVDISVGMSGPHDFAVRFARVRLFESESVHRSPRPTFVTIAKRPSYSGTGRPRARDGRNCASDLPDGSTARACGRLARRANQVPQWKCCQVTNNCCFRHSGAHR